VGGAGRIIPSSLRREPGLLIFNSFGAFAVSSLAGWEAGLKADLEDRAPVLLPFSAGMCSSIDSDILAINHKC